MVRKPPYKLMVSYNCGMSYHPDNTSDDPADFVDRIAECERDYLRWFIEDANGTLTHLSSIHAKAIAVLASS